MSTERDFEDVIECLQQFKNRKKGATVLIGAGCSVEAGIKTANEFVEIIEEKYPRAYQRAYEEAEKHGNKTGYAYCMAALPPGERLKLIAADVDKAEINWAHVALAQLMKAGYIDKVLTTNFDPLIVRACSLINLFPPAYDFATSHLFKPAEVPDQAIYYLHGRRWGFVMLHTEKDFKKHFEHLIPVFEDAGSGRPWIVVGYSGDNDPVFNHLSKVNIFDHNLFWVCYENNEPSEHVRNKLLDDNKFAYSVKGYNADGFFVELARRLKCFPPEMITKPFSHVEKCLNKLTQKPLPGQNDGPDITYETRDMINKAKEKYEVPNEIKQLFMQGNINEIIELHTKLGDNIPSNVVVYIAWSYIMIGNNVSEKAKGLDGEEANKLFNEAYYKYKKAVEIKPDMHEAFYNWGIALSDHAKQKEGKEAEELFSQAYEKYGKAVEIKPEKHEAFYNWGIALYEQAKQKTGNEADELFTQSYEKYGKAVEIKSDKHEAYNNWGAALYELAKQKMGKEADELFTQSYEKYGKAVELKPDYHEAFYNWGTVLSDHAKQKTGSEADELFAESYEKYGKAVNIKPDYLETFNNWTNALVSHSRNKAGKEKDDLLTKAEILLRNVEDIKSGFGSYNLACINSIRNNEDECLKWLENSYEHGKLVTIEHMNEDSDLDNVRDKDWFKDFIKKVSEERK